VTEKTDRGGRPPTAAALLERELRRVDEGRRFRRILCTTIFTLIAAAAVAVLAATLLFPVLRVYGASMAPTLQEGDVLVAVKTAAPAQGDLVAFYYGNKVLVKRCVAGPGDVVDLDETGAVFVNGQALDEPYLAETALGTCDIDLPCLVPDGRYFVLGDQRETSIDSRSSLVGFVAPEQLIGRVVLRLWPPGRLGALRE